MDGPLFLLLFSIHSFIHCNNNNNNNNMSSLLRWYHPVVINRLGRSVVLQCMSTTSTTSTTQQILQTWHCNGRKLKLQWLLWTAAAAAAQQQQQQKTITRLDNTTKPQQWLDWSRRNWTDELLAQVGTSRFQRWRRAVTRLLSLTALATPFLLLYPLTSYHTQLQQWNWQYARWALECAGPTFVKLAQWATTRHDLFSPEFCSYFGTLRDDTTGHTWTETLQVLPPNFLKHVALETTPIGSGCIAQVYKGTLLQSTGTYPAGTQLAVKVQHPGIFDKVCVDFYLMAKVAAWCEALPYLQLHYLSLQDTVAQFRDIMLPQLDLTLEAQHLQRFANNFQSDPRVSFPVPLMEWTTSQVLTETFVHGIPILEFVRDKTENSTSSTSTSSTSTSSADNPYSDQLRKQIALLGLETTLKMIFLDDFLHGDLHPGNILVSWDEQTQQPHLHLLDCGIVLEMGPEQHVNVVKILGAFTRQDGAKAGQLMVDTSSTRHQASDVDVQLFVQGIQHIVEADKEHNFVENVGDYIVDICYLACMHKVKLEPSFVSAALAVEIMEGIAAALYPELKVIPVALPLVLKAEVMHRLPKFHLW